MAIRAKVGDVFIIAIDEERSAIGIVASKWEKELLILVFDKLRDDVTSLEDVTSQEPLLGSSSLDAKIWHGHWPIIGHVDKSFSSMQPIYKVQTPDGWIAESFDRKWHKAIDAASAAELKFRKCVAPVRLEKAIQAYFRREGWEREFDDLLYKHVRTFRDVRDIVSLPIIHPH